MTSAPAPEGREFAVGDRLYFLKNERSLGVKNGSLGTIEKLRDGVLQVRMDGDKGRRVVVDSRFYRHLEHGYATTLHKSQSATVDRTYVLATPHFDRHSAYVALSRHRESATMFYGQEDFRGGRHGRLRRISKRCCRAPGRRNSRMTIWSTVGCARQFPRSV